MSNDAKLSYLQYFCRHMDKQSWVDYPHSIGEINPSPAFATTLQILKQIAASYQRKGMRPSWRTTRFQYMVVIARIIQSYPNFVITDNTDILIHEPNNHPIGPDVLINHHYYRFVFEITPYTNDSLCIIKIQPVSSSEFCLHLAEAIQAELVSQLHKKIFDYATEHEQVKVNSNVKKEEVKNVIAQHSSFTVKDIQREVDCEAELLAQILKELCYAGKIGDMGRQYIVINSD